MDNPPLVVMRHISKSFSGIYALTDISMEVKQGEVFAIVGENGAGKSTLMKILSGAYVPDSGEIVVDGNIYKYLEPMQALKLGISIIHQENLLAPTISVLENIFAGHELTKGALMDYPAMRKTAVKEMESIGMRLDLDMRVEQLSAAKQQYVKILKAMMFKPRLLIMDEPTSMFNVEDVDKVLAMIRRIVEERGVSIIYISHFLKEVVQIADRVMVLRDGCVVNTYSNPNNNLPLKTLTNDMVGRPVDMFYIKDESPIGDVLFEAKNVLVSPKSEPVSLSVHKGEILGIAGMVGSGRTEILQALCGVAPLYSGQLYMEDHPVTIRKPADAIALGIGYVTDDRQKLGLMLNQNILENTTIVGLGRKIKGFLVQLKSHIQLVKPILDSLKVKYHSLWQEIRTLSGGNQQKVVLAKWLFADAKLILFDEPTRGVDVNAKWEFYKIMNRLVAEGKSIIMVSSDMPELVSMSDRVLVVRNGRITCELQKDEINENAIIKYALEVENNG